MSWKGKVDERARSLAEVLLMVLAQSCSSGSLWAASDSWFGTAGCQNPCNEARLCLVWLYMTPSGMYLLHLFRAIKRWQIAVVLINCCGKSLYHFHRITESLKVEKTFKIIKSHHQPSTTTTVTTQPCSPGAKYTFCEHFWRWWLYHFLVQFNAWQSFPWRNFS